MLAQYIPASGSAVDVDFLDKYAFIIDGSAFEIVDISSPNNPQLFKRINSVSGWQIIIRRINTVEGFKNYGFIKTLYGIEIVDINDVENIPPFNTFFLSGIRDFDIKDNYLFIVSDSTLEVYDLSGIADYSNPSLISKINTSSRNFKVTFVDKYAFLGQQKGLRIVDISNPGNLILLNEIDNYTSDCPFELRLGSGIVTDSILIIASETTCAQFFLFNISDPVNPVFIDTAPLIIGYPDITSVFMADSFYYYTVTSNGGGVFCVDITDPMNQELVGNFKNIPKSGGTSVKVREDIVYFCGFMNGEPYPMNQQGGLFVLKNDLITGLKTNYVQPANYTAIYVYPNPFNPAATIEVQIPNRDYVILEIYNTLGGKVCVLYEGILHGSISKFEFNSSGLSSGVYYSILRTKNKRVLSKLILLK